MRKSANDFSTTGENKNKTNKLHLATCYLNHSQLQFLLFLLFFLFLSSVGVTGGHVYLSVLLRVRLGWEKEPGRYLLGRPFQVQMPPGSTGKWLWAGVSL